MGKVQYITRHRDIVASTFLREIIHKIYIFYHSKRKLGKSLVYWVKRAGVHIPRHFSAYGKYNSYKLLNDDKHVYDFFQLRIYCLSISSPDARDYICPRWNSHPKLLDNDIVSTQFSWINKRSPIKSILAKKWSYCYDPLIAVRYSLWRSIS